MSQGGLGLYPPPWNRQNDPSFLGLQWGWDEMCGLTLPLALCKRSRWWLCCYYRSRLSFLLRILKGARHNILYGSHEPLHRPVHKYAVSSFMVWIVICLPLAGQPCTKLLSVLRILYWGHTHWPPAVLAKSSFHCLSHGGIGKRKRLCIVNEINRKRTLWRNCCNADSVISMFYM